MTADRMRALALLPDRLRPRSCHPQEMWEHLHPGVRALAVHLFEQEYGRPMES